MMNMSLTSCNRMRNRVAIYFVESKRVMDAFFFL